MAGLIVLQPHTADIVSWLIMKIFIRQKWKVALEKQSSEILSYTGSMDFK